MKTMRILHCTLFFKTKAEDNEQSIWACALWIAGRALVLSKNRDETLNPVPLMSLLSEVNLRFFSFSFSFLLFSLPSFLSFSSLLFSSFLSLFLFFSFSLSLLFSSSLLSSILFFLFFRFSSLLMSYYQLV